MIPWWYIALSTAIIDLETGLFGALNFDIACRIPVAGRILSDITGRTREFLSAHQWIDALYCAGIIMAVAMPFLGSGGISESITGKLLGVDTWLVYAAIIAGALIGALESR